MDPVLPKHIPFPETTTNPSEIINELIMFLFILFAAGMQFLHIYRTSWWLPNSYITHTVNLYLIDPYLVIFITVMVSRRLLYCLMNKCLEIMYKEKQLKLHKFVAKYCYVSSLTCILGSCILKIYTKQNYLCLFLLLYPLVVYSLIFGLKIEPFLRTSCEVEGTYLNGFPMHCCSSNPATIRDEIEILKNDFNSRFKQVIFTSVINAYYSGFVPCFFAQNFLYYDVMAATHHIIFVWISGFTMAAVFCFPTKYCDILHRSALHLGHWNRIDGRTNSMNVPPSTWTKTIAWIQGSIVRHSGDLYKAVGPVTSATPGNISHSRYYKLFINPSCIYLGLSIIQTFLVTVQICMLFFSEWHNILSLSFLTLTNHHTLFKILRDYLVTQKVYAAETTIYEKLNTHFN